MSASCDVVVIGAGIHGAGVAQACAAAGHSVLVLERSGVAAGSSSRSSKLVHGGLRYLESAQLRLVRESLHERRVLLRVAPELVRMQVFHIPVYPATHRRPWQLRAGLALYSLLSGAGGGHGTVPRSRWDALDGLDPTGLEQVFWYHDAQTDDALLTAAVLRSAGSLGAQLLVPASFSGAELHGDGVQVRYEQAGREQECSARVLVNAAGPWAAGLARLVTPAPALPAVELVQGTHLVLDGAPQSGCYYVESPHDGRAVFVLPWRGKLLLGTTEVRYSGDPARVAPGEQERHYLLGVLRHYFPRFRDVAAHPVVEEFAGLRVLPGGGGRAFHRSRETMLVPDRRVPPRMLTVLGGKLTTYRAVAGRVLGLIAPSLPQRPALARTDELPLSPQ
jgi:glycerol-3-phosphate dehydrogenase